MAVKTLQVTLTGAVQPIIPSGNILAKWVIFQNNATHSMRLGDANITSSRGMQLLAGGSGNPLASAPISATSLSYWNVIGTAADVLDVIYDDGVL